MFLYTKELGPVLNPLKGWVLNDRTSPTPEDGLLFDVVGCGRMVTTWAKLEPAPGVFDWEEIDAFMASYRAQGKRTMVYIMGYPPQHLFDAGVEAIDTLLYDNIGRKFHTRVCPAYDDPIFLERLEVMLRAVAERYDADENFEMTFVSSLGNWGENHSITLHDREGRYKTMQRHIEIHREAFPNTDLALVFGEQQYQDIYNHYMLNCGLGMARLGIMGNSSGAETLPAMGKGPGVFEFWGPYQMMKDYGWWDGKRLDAFPDGSTVTYYFPKNAMDWWGWEGEMELGLKHNRACTLVESIMNGRPTHIEFGHRPTCAKQMVEEIPEFVTYWANHMGYSFFVHAAQFVEKGPFLHIDAMIHNDGVSMLYRSAVPTIALVGENGLVARECEVGTFDLKTIWPDTYKELAVNFPVAGLAPGKYTVALGFFRPGQGKVRIGQPLPESWIRAQNVEVMDNRFMKLGEYEIK